MNAPSSDRFNPQRGRSQWLGLLVALATIGLIFLLRWIGGVTLSDQPLITVFLIPVILGAYIGGLWPGLVSAVIVAILTDYFILLPYGFGIDSSTNRIRWASVLIVGILTSSLSEALHRSRRRSLINQNMLAVTLASIGDGVITTDTRGLITFINAIAESLTGWKSQEAIGRPLSEVLKIIQLETRQAAEDPVAKVLQTGEATGLADHTLLISKDGRETPIDDSSAPIRKGNGPLQGVVLVFRDCTHRYQAEKALADRLALQQRLTHIHEVAPVALCEYLVTVDGAIRMPFSSPRIEQIYGISSEELARDASVIYKLIHPEDAEHVHRSIAESARALSPWRDEFRVMHPQRGEIWVEGHSVPSREPDGTMHWYGFISDITDRRRSDAAMRRWADAFEFCAHGIAIGDPRTATILACNPAYARMHQRTVSEIAGRKILDVYDPAQRDRVRDLIAEADRVGKVQFETNMSISDGVLLPVQMDVVSVRDSAGELKYRVATAQDISVRRQTEAALKQSELRLRSVIETLSEGLIMSDLDGNLIHWNRTALQMHGFETVDEVRRKLDDFTRIFELRTLDGTVVSFNDWPLARILRGDELRGLELILRRIDISWERIYQYGGALVRDSAGQPLVAMLTIINVTAEKLAIQSLRKAKEAAEAASHAKDQFLAVLSHELRTPLTPVLLVASALENKPDIPESIREDLTIIRTNTQAEARLIDDLLDLTRITHGKFSLETSLIDIHEQVDRAVSICREEIGERRQSLSVELTAKHTRIQGDPQRIQQVVWNLLQNASKYTSFGGRLVVRTYNQPRNARNGFSPDNSYVVTDFPPQSDPSREVVVIEVEDSGMGIAVSSLPLIFDPFEQPHRTLQNGVGGIGLGLTITRAIVESHRGAMIVKSEGEGKGSKFVVQFVTRIVDESKLRPAKAPEAPEAASPAAVSSRKVMRLLLVEDHVVTARNLQRLLQTEGYEVIVAHDLAGGKEILAGQTFDVLLTDLGLPDGDGSELMNMVRKNGSPTRGVVLSGYGMEADIARTREAGFDAHLIKPITADELFETIERLRPAPES